MRMVEESNLAEVVEALDQGYLVTDASGTVVDVSGRCCELLGIQREQAMGSSLAELLLVNDLDGQPIFLGDDSRLSRCARDGEKWRAGLRGLDVEVNGQHRVLAISMTRLSTGGVAVAVGDAWELREVLEAHDALVSITSHELKTPLTAIKAMSELLEAYELEPEQRKEMIGDIYQQAERLEKLIREILDASQIDSGRMPLAVEATNLKEVVGEVLDELQTQIATRKVTIDIARGLPDVSADRAKLAQVLVNLLTNAIKYSPEGAPVLVRASLAGGMVRVDVTDKGVGIRQEDLGRLFKKFQRISDPATRHASGTGLGLYIIKGLVELQGGSIDVKSQHGKGSTFGFTIPVHRSAD